MATQKRQLYEELFPHRVATYSNRHYSRLTMPKLLKMKAQREAEYEAFIIDQTNSGYEYQGEEGQMQAYEDFPYDEWIAEQN